jgi:hypothetical protein
MIMVQKLVTRWTKQSRGGAAAAERNATPREALLPPLGATRRDVLVHTIVFREDAGFVPTPSVDVIGIDGLTKITDELDLALEEDTLHVCFRWSDACGAPGRPNGRAIPLRPAQWCRVLHNGRHAREDQWVYQNTVLNVGTGPLVEDFFLATAPVASSDHRASLR